MGTSEYCSWLRRDKSGFSCALRNQLISSSEVAVKCSDIDQSVICIDAYSSLSKGKELIAQQSTEALLWMVEAATQFENLGETDNAIMAVVSAINFAVDVNLISRAYELFKYARSVYENGLERGDPALDNPAVKEELVKAGRRMIRTARKLKADDAMRSMQAELKAAVLSGGGLKKVEREEKTKDILVVDGRQLYAKKSKEYKEGAEKYIASGIVKNEIVFACMGALADLMLGKPKDGIEYLTQIAEKSDFKEKFHEDPCFNWTKLVFRGLVSRDKEAIEKARKDYFKIPFAFKDDKEFARRVMDSVYRRVMSGT